MCLVSRLPLAQARTHAHCPPPPTPRYVQEYRTKLAFIWPHLTPGQRRGYMSQALAELPGSRLIIPALHIFVAMYLLGMCTVVAWIACPLYTSTCPHA
jgi:hypothetical protein